MDEQKKFLVPGFYLLFFISGVSGLVYQSLWLRMFTLVIGNSLHSASLVFAAFMCGLGLGAWFFGRYVEGKKEILGVYIALELGIALTGLAVGKAIPSLGHFIPALQRWLFGYLPFLYLFRLSVSFVIMLVPASLIGGTLPVLSHFLTRRLDLAGKRIGGLYGWNTMGAVAGCAATGFWLLRVAGMSVSLYTAVALNLLVALAALALRGYAGSFRAGAVAGGRRVPAEAPGPAVSKGMQRLLTVAAGITGMAALGCEVVWARFLSFLLHNDIYAYYLMLSCVLLGIGLGSLVYSRWLDRVQRRLLMFGLLETGLGLAVAVCYLACAFVYRWSSGAAAFMRLQNFLLDLFADPFYSLISIRLLFTLVALFLPSLVMGAVFPLICRLYLVDERSVGSGTGSIYAANAAGAVAGALACGFFLVPGLGVQNSLFIVAALNLTLGAGIFLYEAWRSGAGAAGRVAVLAAAALAFGLLFLLPGNQVKEFVMKDKKYTHLIYYREGLSGTVAVLEDRVDSTRTLYINSVAEVHNGLAGMQTFKVMGHLPLLLYEGSPRKVLMVTFGGGIASGAVARHPIEELEVVELEPAVVDASGVFIEENRGVLDDPRVRIYLDDGRNHLSSADRLYDIIISDSTNPASSDSWLLYTLEFYLLCRQSLAPGGIMAQWLPLHSGSTESYCAIVRTFQAVFPHTSIWFTKDYTLLVGTAHRLSISYPGLVDKLSAGPIREDLAPYCLDEPLELLDCFLMGEASVRRMAGKARISTDDLPFYQLTTAEQNEPQEILAMLENYRDRVFPLIRGVDGPRAEALKDSLERYYRSEGFLLRRDFAAAAAVNPSSCKVRRFYGEYLDQVPYVQAIAGYDPQNYNLQLRAALALAAHREYARAREYFVHLLTLRPGDPSHYSTLGNIDFITGSYETSVINYRKALELDPSRSDLLGRLGRALAAVDSCGEAIEVFREALQRDSTDLASLFNLGLCYSRMEQINLAADCYEKVLRLDPDYPEALVNLGSICLGRGKVEDAERLFLRAAGLMPQSYSAWRGLGISLFRQQKYAESSEVFRKVLEIEPQDRLAQQFLARIAELQQE